MAKLRTATHSDSGAVAELIFNSTNHWYESHGFGKIFPGVANDCSLFFDVYEDLDPGCCLVAEDDDTGALIGSCFFHSRESHVSLGIMNAHPSYGGRGIAKALLKTVISIAESEEKPLRLFSSAMNLDSYSLYTRNGFSPYAIFQDMQITVPDEGLPLDGVSTDGIRDAVIGDVESIAALEDSVWGISRRCDWAYFIENKRGIWHCSVLERGRAVVGAVASVNHPGSNMIGPGVARNDQIAGALITAELNQHRNHSPVVLVPAGHQELVALMSRLGARNCELHIGQSLGPPPVIQGVVLPTFMPETG